VRVVHEKTREENWVPLFDDAGVPLYPELMGELDALKHDRIGGLMLCRDWGEKTAADRVGNDRENNGDGKRLLQQRGQAVLAVSPFDARDDPRGNIRLRFSDP
jgi:hypothetical protein